MEILKEWLNHQVQLSEVITDFEEQFSNGYLLCELMHRFNQIIHMPLSNRVDNTKQALLRNYSTLYPILTEFKIPFDSNTAYSIIYKKPQVVTSLLRNMKNSLDKTLGIVDFKIYKSTGIKNMTFPLKRFTQNKDIYDSMQLSIFVKRLNTLLPAQKQVDLRAKLSRFEQMKEKHVQEIQKHKQELEDNENRNRENRRAVGRENMRNGLEFKQSSDKLDNVKWQENMATIKQQISKKEMFQERIRQKEAELRVGVRESIKQQFVSDIEAFDSRLEILHQKSTAEVVYDKDELYQFPVENKKQIIGFIMENINVNRIRDQIKMRKNELQSDFNKKERDRRLRKLLVDLKKWQDYKDVTYLKERMLSTLLSESRQEEEVRYEFHKTNQFYNIMVENSRLWESMRQNQKAVMEEQVREINLEYFQQMKLETEARVLYHLQQQNKYLGQLEQKSNQRTFEQVQRSLMSVIDNSVVDFEVSNQVNLASYRDLLNFNFEKSLLLNQSNFKFESDINGDLTASSLNKLQAISEFLLDSYLNYKGDLNRFLPSFGNQRSGHECHCSRTPADLK